MFKITIIALGNKMPSWVEEAIAEFKKRLQDGISFTLVEIPLIRRGKTADFSRILEKEMAAMHSAIPQGARIIALDVKGHSFSSKELACKLEKIQQINSHLCFLIGGPEGLSQEMVAKSDEQWSLSQLTLPHTLARIFLMETLYRSWSILKNHPYHK